MPASSLFATELERPTPTPSAAPSTEAVDQERALQLALELSILSLNPDNPYCPQQNLQNEGYPQLDADRANKRSQNMTECVAVPSSEHVAEIVGRQGCKIKALRAKTNTYIKTPVRGENPTFLVTGRKEDVAMAKREILSAADHFSQIRACRKNNLNGSMAPGPPTNVPGQVTIQVRVPYRVVGLVVGPKGATIKRIQQQTHTYIVTPSRDKEPVFEVTGMPESVEQAKKEIEAHIAVRTGGLMDQDDPNAPRPDYASNQIDTLFQTQPELVSSLYKLQQSGANGMNSLNPMSSNISNLANGLSGMPNLPNQNTMNNMMAAISGTSNLNSMNSLNNALSGFNDISSYSLLGDTATLLSGGKNDNSLFPNLSSSSKLSDLQSNGYFNNLYNPSSVDEGLGSIGSSMGSSPSFEPTQGSIWGELGKSLGTTLGSNNISSNSSLSSTFSSLSSNISSSLTRRSSSVSGASPPSSRLSPTLDMHAPARRISSDPAPTLAALTSAYSSNLGGLPNSSPPTSSPSSTSPDPSMAHMNGFVNPPTTDKKCRTCHESDIGAALVPCGHSHFCIDCATKHVGDHNGCPTCGSSVNQAIRILT